MVLVLGKTSDPVIFIGSMERSTLWKALYPMLCITLFFVHHFNLNSIDVAASEGQKQQERRRKEYESPILLGRVLKERER